MVIDTQIIKEKLLSEKAELEKELETVSRRNPKNPEDFEAVPKVEERPSERDEIADKLESFEENIAIVRQLEARYDEIRDALARLEQGTYGTCQVCGKEIENERLRANPAAPTCKAHLK